ncbi:unnamed protein product [Caenorhabditis bovis]|uniref:Tetratricopeptide repeat protein n=1 Tax=Caenorhabditis bovis TaxID=2654633 RepID=A0A8S1ENL3_9PELO|nr:unnamed protein product [Caenorhabditis bovis]
MDTNLETIVHEAGRAYSEGRYEDSRILYENALENYPNNGILHANLSAIMIKIGFNDRAIEHSKRAVELCPKWGKAYYRLGDAFRASSNIYCSLMAFCHGVRIDPANSQMFRCLSEMISRNFESFPWQQLEILKLKNDPSAVLSTVGECLLAQGKAEDAVKTLEWSLEMNLSSKKLRESVLGALGSAYCGLFKFQNALECYEKQLELATELGSNHESINMIRENLAFAAEECRKYELAALQRTIVIDSGKLNREEMILEKIKIAGIYSKMGQIADSIIILKDCSVTCNSNISKETRELVCKRLGFAYADQNLFDKAIEILVPLCEKGSNDLELIEKINNCYIGLDRLKKSIEFLRDMTQNTNQITMLHSSCLLCQSHIFVSNLTVALKIAKRVLQISRNRVEYKVYEANSYRLLAIIYDNQKDFSSAIILWKKFVEISMDGSVKALLEISRLLGKCSTNENALNYINKAIERSRNSNEMIICLSAKYRYYLANSKKSEALGILEKLKTYMNDDLDSKFRSLIFEDVALFKDIDHEHDTIIALEQSLTEAQDSSDVYREVEILERIGVILSENKNYEKAEKYYCQQLEVARELRNAKLMADAHANICRLKMKTKSFGEAADHAKCTLTLLKISSNHSLKLEMLINLASADYERKNYEAALNAIEKALSLADECDSNEYLAKACRLTADLFKVAQDDEEMLLDILERHLGLFEYENSNVDKCRTIIDVIKLNIRFIPKVIHFIQLIIPIVEKLEVEEKV